MKIDLAQINPRLGNFEYNSNKIIEFCKNAKQTKTDILIFPELALLGYSPNDLLERPELFKKQNKYINRILKQSSKDFGFIVGCLVEEKGQLFNGAVFIHDKKIKKTFKKTLLPSYDVFDEHRHFTEGDLNKNFFTFKGRRLLVAICEDLWGQDSNKYKSNPLKSLKQKPHIILSLNASPFHKNKVKLRENIVKSICKKLKCSVYYVNQVGAQDEIIFDGKSFVMDKDGKKTIQLAGFEEDSSYDLLKKEKNIKGTKDKFALIESALVLGLKDYFSKTGFEKAHLGLSGGIDSALVLYLAAKALGPQNITGIAMPGPYSSELSFGLAEKISSNLNTKLKSFDIKSSYEKFTGDFEKSFGEKKFSMMNENIQARLRGLTLMAFSNRENSLLLATSNKSELTVGYSTLYGDQCGALMPIGDLLKTEIFDFCKWINKTNNAELIPNKIISRPPTAELRANQKDSDSIPDYKELDSSIERVITLCKKPTSALDKWVLNKSFQSEFKRWQSAPILRVSEHAFGRGRRMPIAHNYKL